MSSFPCVTTGIFGKNISEIPYVSKPRFLRQSLAFKLPKLDFLYVVVQVHSFPLV